MPEDISNNSDSQEPDYIKRVIFYLLNFRRSSFADTNFFINKKHNNYLVPQFDIKIDDILKCFTKYRSISHDTQGRSDHGIDVLLKYTKKDSDGDNIKLIGFQLKSLDDLENRDWLRIIKAQATDALNYAALEDYYLVICTDYNRHLDKIRAINAEFSKRKDIHIINPESAFTFFNLTSSRIGSIIKIWFSKEDQIYLAAQKELEELTPHQGAIIIELLISHYFDQKWLWMLDDLKQQPLIENINRLIPNYLIKFYWQDDEYLKTHDGFNEQNETLERSTWADDIEALETFFDNYGAEPDYIKLNLKSVSALAAMAFDGYVRYEYKNDVLKNYMMDTFFSDKIEKAQRIKYPQEDRAGNA